MVKAIQIIQDMETKDLSCSLGGTTHNWVIKTTRYDEEAKELFGVYQCVNCGAIYEQLHVKEEIKTFRDVFEEENQPKCIHADDDGTCTRCVYRGGCEAIGGPFLADAEESPKEEYVIPASPPKKVNIIFSRRAAIAKEAEEWCLEHGASVCPHGIVSALNALGYLRDKTKKENEKA